MADKSVSDNISIKEVIQADLEYGTENTLTKDWHESERTVKDSMTESGFSNCNGKGRLKKENTLLSLYPEIAAQWVQEKNGDYSLDEVKYWSEICVWWRCEKGHEWKASVYARTSNGGCPYCSGQWVLKGYNDLLTLNPELALEWNTEKNNGITAEQVHPGSNNRYWWKCSLGHEWQARLSSRTGIGTGCPYCANRKVLKGFNDLATIEPRIAAQWHPTLNGSLTPDTVLSGSHKYGWWLCSEGLVWKARIESRVKYKYGCPVCAGKTRKNVGYSFVDEKYPSMKFKTLNGSEQTGAGCTEI